MTSAGGNSRVGASTLFPVVWMCHRNLTRFVRLPAILVPMVVMPVFFLVVFTSSFDGISRFDGYPTENLINWVVAFALLQGAMFSGVGTAGSVANDIETGFIDRLLVSPVRRGIIIAAPLTYTAIRALIPITLVTILAFAMNADLPRWVGWNRGGLCRWHRWCSGDWLLRFGGCASHGRRAGDDDRADDQLLGDFSVDRGRFLSLLLDGLDGTSRSCQPDNQSFAHDPSGLSRRCHLGRYLAWFVGYCLRDRDLRYLGPKRTDPPNTVIAPR